MEFAEKIKFERENAGFTVQELADKTGFINEVIERLEDGRMFPDVRHLTQIAKALGLKQGHFIQHLVNG